MQSTRNGGSLLVWQSGWHSRCPRMRLISGDQQRRNYKQPKKRYMILCDAAGGIWGWERMVLAEELATGSEISFDGVTLVR